MDTNFEANNLVFYHSVNGLNELEAAQDLGEGRKADHFDLSGFPTGADQLDLRMNRVISQSGRHGKFASQ